LKLFRIFFFSDLPDLIGIDLFPKPTRMINNLTKERQTLRELAGLRWQLRSVNGEDVLAAWLNLEDFFSWWRTIPTVADTFKLPKGILLCGRFLDGFPLFRWSNYENGQVQLCLKILNCPSITDSALVSIPIGRYKL
jgi:hypothetical protein